MPLNARPCFPAETCTVSPTQLLCREQIYEIISANLMANFLAEDLARGNEYANDYTARLKENIDEIKRVLDEIDKGGAAKSAFYSYVETAQDSLLDTYAFGTLVLEAQRPNPDYDRINKEVVPNLTKVLEHLEGSIAKKPQVDRADFAELRVVQAHLASARELMGQ